MGFHFCNGESSIIVGTACQQNNLFYFLKRHFRKIWSRLLLRFSREFKPISAPSDNNVPTHNQGTAAHFPVVVLVCYKVTF